MRFYLGAYFSEKGLRLQMRGVGTGPQARFTASELDFGEVVVHAQATADVQIVNTVSPTDLCSLT